MYEQFYGLTDKPFSLTPNPRFAFDSRQYREVQGRLLYGIENREGLMLLTGQPGTGKTTLCRDLLEKLDRDKTQSAMLFNPLLNGIEMLAALLTEFGVSVPPGASRKDLLDRLNQFLLAQLALGKRCVAIFDEAQHLSSEFLEQVRVLSNLETDQEKLIQIVLAGQPDLLDRIRTPNMAQLDQRVSIRCTLDDLDEQETGRYIQHRLDVAGARGQIRFTPKAVAAIYHASHGVPRLINLLSDRALLAAYAAQTHDIEPEHVRKAIAALRGEDADVDANVNVATASGAGSGRRATVVGAVVVVTAAAIAGMFALRPKPSRRPTDEALYWRATMATSPLDAEPALDSLVSTYPGSKRYDDALLRLARIEMGHGDRANAVRRLSLLAQRAPAGLTHARALVLAALVQLDGGDTTAACRTAPTALDSAASADAMLFESFQTVATACLPRATAPTAAAAGVATGATDSATHPAPARDSAVAPKRSTNDTAKPRRAKTAPVPHPTVPPPSVTPPVVPPVKLPQTPTPASLS